jgi:hypothetical protein
MKTTIKLAAIFLALLIAVACSPDKPTPEPEPDPIDNNDGDDNGDDNNGDDDDGYVAGTGDGTYIAEFVENDTFILHGALWERFIYNPYSPYNPDDKRYIIGTAIFNPEPETTYIGFITFRLTMDGDNYIPTKSDSTEYKRLVAELRDTTSPMERNGVHDDIYMHPYDDMYKSMDYVGVSAILNRITNFEITSEPQYVSTIPYGEPINELFDLWYSDMAGFVWKGYERPEDSYISYVVYRISPEGHWISSTDLPTYYTKVSAADKNAYCIDYIGQDVFVSPLVPPDDETQKYTITFTVTFADGTVVSRQFEQFLYTDYIPSNTP